MYKFAVIVATGLAAWFISQPLFADSTPPNTHEIEKALHMQGGALGTMLIDAGAGELSIVGNDSTQIMVEAKIVGDNLAPGDYQLTLQEEDGKAILYAHIKGSMHDNERIDLIVSLPASMVLDVRDRSGDMKVSAMSGGLTIIDSSGDITLTDISGGTTVDDRSGDIMIDGLTGLLQINDRSGEILLKHIEGNASIVDRSGDIFVKHLSGDLTIEDTSGDIKVKKVSGMVSVDDSSGSIAVKEAGDFRLLSDGSGDVTVKNIAKRPDSKDKSLM
ncbi:MAG: hypothetical protein ACJA13_000279 [Paraglaciecola sp.]|jgi:hypothetical protein